MNKSYISIIVVSTKILDNKKYSMQSRYQYLKDKINLKSGVYNRKIETVELNILRFYGKYR